MTDDLPTRPFTALPPPPAGATAAVRGGRGIRRRRRLTELGAAAASMAVVAGVLVAAGSGSPHASDELVPAGPGNTSRSSVDSSTESENGAPGSLTVTTARPTPTGTAQPRATSTTSGQAPRATASPTARAGTSTGGYLTPNLVRRYHPAPPQTGGPSGRICGGGGDGNTNGELNSGYGFCVDAYATRTPRGHDLVLEVCRDSTGPGSLHFTRELEAELVVHDVLDQDRVVWRWSPGHANDEDAHVLKVETSGCWTWTAQWTDVDSRGRELETGKYEVAVDSTAEQLRAQPEQRAAFTIS
ncbi:MAG: hypothetical protein JJD92_08790 [Frankiaceae bacterium]|nr:hypothetical protein [Frankiaceae bacterium]